jgi:membrane-associated phospholipid phosphatase
MVSIADWAVSVMAATIAPGGGVGEGCGRPAGSLRPVALRDGLTAAAPPPHRLALLGGLAGALALLTALVQAGALTAVDQFSADRLMPWLVPGNSSGLSAESFYRPFPLSAPAAIKLLDLWTYPCSVSVSAIVVICAGAVLWQRRGLVAGLAPVAAWLIANGIEVVGKGVLTKPDIFGVANGQRVHVVAYDQSFPSGHMTRGVVVAWALGLVWTRAAPWLGVWAALVAPALVFSSAHTITDVIGGALVGSITVVAVHPFAFSTAASRALG